MKQRSKNMLQIKSMLQVKVQAICSGERKNIIKI